MMHTREFEPGHTAARADERPQQGGDTAGATDELTPAERPTGRFAWLQYANRARKRATGHRVSLLAAGVAFYALLAMVPAMIVSLTIYGLVADPASIREQLVDALAGAPQAVREFVIEQLEAIAARPAGAAVQSLLLGVVLALWSASGGINSLMTAIDVAKGDLDRRPGWRRRIVALGVTVAALFFALLATFVLAILPQVLHALDLEGIAHWLVRLASWGVLLAGLAFGLSILYRLGPDPNLPTWAGLTPGTGVALGLWLLGSVGFSVYTSRFSSYNETYGSLGVVVVVMLWLWISAYAILFGAELNAEVARARRPLVVPGPEPGAPDPAATPADDLTGHSHRRDSEAGQVLLDTEEPGERVAGGRDASGDEVERPAVRP